MKTITFRADANLIEAAHERARSENTTLNERFQRWLTDYAWPKSRADEARDVLNDLRHRVRTGGQKFTRDQRNER